MGTYHFAPYCCHECCIKDSEYWNRVKTTMIERHGVDSPMKSKIIQNKVKETNMKVRGVPYSFMDEKVKDKIRSSHMQRHGGIGFAS